jgi:DNA-binding beta-propeller fold protein YncE
VINDQARSAVMSLQNLGWLALALIIPGAALGQRGAAPELAYEAEAAWPLPPTSAAGAPGLWNLIQAAGVTVNSNGDILVLHRGAHPILQFKSDGRLVRSFGDGLFSEGKVGAMAPEHRVEGRSAYTAVYGPAGCTACGAHSIRLDPQGNIWVVDAPGHVIYKLSQDGQIVMQLGTKGVSGTGHNTFNLPTDIAFAPNGDIYVTDGYGSQRVVRFSRDGDYLTQWGGWGSGPGQFELPHNLAIDAQGRVYVTDRENQRIEVFDGNGTFLKEWPTGSGVSGLFLTKDQQLWAGDALYDLDGKLLGRLPDAQGAHGVVVTDSGDVYLAQLSGTVQKFVKK